MRFERKQWVFVLALYSGFIAFAQRGGERLTSAALGVQGLLALAFLLNRYTALLPAPACCTLDRELGQLPGQPGQHLITIFVRYR